VLSLLVRWSEDARSGWSSTTPTCSTGRRRRRWRSPARRLLADPVFVLAAARLGEPGALLEAGLPTLTLTGLDLAGTGQLAASTAPTSRPPRSPRCTGPPAATRWR
jgi:hypothetical protein